MHFTFRNVNDAFHRLVSGLDSGEIPTTESPSRAGPVRYVQEPVIITYTHPRERVLFNPMRDCNVFFHLYESLWMLAGRNDVASLAYYNSQIADIASDNGETFNGAYGYRWRNNDTSTSRKFTEEEKEKYGTDGTVEGPENVDQLEVIIEHFKANPQSRRAVLAMWNVEDDLLKIDFSKDVCCNTHVYFSIRKQELTKEQDPRDWEPSGRPFVQHLDMTVCNRSNDLIWGLLGANVVHFSFLQEYMASMIGVQVGTYNQFTNNMHYYTERWEATKWLNTERLTMHDPPMLAYPGSVERIQPLINDPTLFDKDLQEFVDFFPLNVCDQFIRHWREPFFQETARWMMYAFKAHKDREYDEAFSYMNDVSSDDWRLAGNQWLTKRRTNWEGKQDVRSSESK